LVPDASRAVGACAIGEIACFTTVRFASAGRTLFVSRRALSSRHGACGPCLWHPCRFLPTRPGARAPGRRTEGCRDRVRRAGVNDARRTAIRDAFHRARAIAPQRPLERPALALSRPRGLAAAMPFFDAFGPREPRGSYGPDPRSRSPLPPGRASLDLGFARRFLQPKYDARAHPASSQALAREWGSRPAASRHPWIPVALAARCVAAAAACEPRTARDGLRESRSTCVDGADHGPKHPSEGMSALLGRTLRVPSSKYSVHPRHRHGSSRTLERFASRRAGRDPPTGAPSRKDAALADQGAFSRAGTRTRTVERCSPIRARTEAPSRRLRRGIARGLTRLFRPRRCACF
jgi:hypothetical protein